MKNCGVKENATIETRSYPLYDVEARIVQKGLFTFAHLTLTTKIQNKVISCVGFSKCDPSWVFNSKFGRYVAVNRACTEMNEKMLPPLGLPPISDLVTPPNKFKHMKVKDWIRESKAKAKQREEAVKNLAAAKAAKAAKKAGKVKADLAKPDLHIAVVKDQTIKSDSPFVGKEEMQTGA